MCRSKVVIVHSGSRGAALELSSSLSRYFSSEILVLEDDADVPPSTDREARFVVLALLSGPIWPEALNNSLFSTSPRIAIITDGRFLAEGCDSVLTRFDDFIVAPFREDEVVWRIKRWLDADEGDDRERLGRNIFQKLGMASIIGRDPAFLEVVEKIPLIAEGDASVLLLGETGVGKEVCARAIHYLSDRSDKPFIPVDCGAIPTNLIENELFGHRKGAYTDARDSSLGLVAEAEGGTLFLDEINSLDRQAQGTLLRLLQEKTYRPLGHSKQLRANVRIIGATNVDLYRKVQEGEFRRDLYYRFCVTISLPPLRERTSDIPELVEFFLRKHQDQCGKERKLISPAAMKKLVQYDWPGNIRELENVIQKALLLTKSSLIGREHILFDGASAEEESDSLSFAEAKKSAVEKFEKDFVMQALARANGNISLAARMSGKDRADFSRMVKKYCPEYVFPRQP